MAGFSNYWRNKLLSHGFGKEVYVAPAGYYVGLSLTEPLGDASGLFEPNGLSYGRVFTDSDDWEEISSFETHNIVTIQFAKALEAWGTVPWFVIFDALTSGNMLAYGAINPINVLVNDIITFDPDDLIVTH